MNYKFKKDRKLSKKKKEVEEKRKKECTFQPIISQKSQLIFGEYQKVFLRRKSQKINFQKKQLKKTSSQMCLRGKRRTYKGIHYDKNIFLRKQEKFLKAKFKLSENEYMLGYDRNRRGSVFDHLYEQRKVQKAKRLRLFQRVQDQECPFQPNSKGSKKFNQEEFFRRTELFLKKKIKFLRQEEKKLKAEFFKPNLDRRDYNNRCKSVHSKLYENQEKENVKRQKLIQKYKVSILMKGRSEIPK